MATTVFRKISVGLALACVLATSLAATCPLGEGEDECDPETDPACAPAPDAGAFKTYHYVMVLDQESTDTAGIELDAVALTKGGATHYADAMHECVQGVGISNSTQTDCNQALGPPDNEEGTCTGSDTFYVNLGGLGGSIVVSFSDLAPIETGDRIRVYECGTPSVSDIYHARVGTGTSVSDANWVPCISNGTRVSECTVPALPNVPED